MDSPARSNDVTMTSVTRRFRLGGGQTLTAVDDVSLYIPAGSAVAISGPSGSGKSTLLHLVGAIERPDAGTITVGDCELTRMSRPELARYRRRIGFVFQRYNLLPALTARDNVMAPVLPYRTNFDKGQRARELLSAVGLAGRESSLPSRLSGGQQQRVAIARALINAPALLLADEPTGNLDSTTGREILRLLLDIRAEHAITLIIATHDPHVAARCDRLIRLVDGQLADDLNVPSTTEPEALLKRITGPAPA